MPRQDGSIHRELRRLFAGGTLTGLDDAALLERFVAHRDERAFEAIVAAHGRMVLGVCRGILADPHAAEDAFQATFLILARKAGSIRVDGSLGRWLYGVARRVARRARDNQTRLATRESGRVPATDVPLTSRSELDDRLATLHHEVGRLPEKYRAPIILCYLEGRTHEEAARLLHWPVGTVKGRLARARRHLRDRLTRRGIAPSAGLLSVSLASEMAFASPLVPADLLNTTARSALQFAGKSCLPAVSISSSTALAKGVLKGMALHKLKVAATIFGIGTLGAGVYAQNERGTIGNGEKATSAVPEVVADPESTTDPEPSARRTVATETIETEIVNLKSEAKSLRESVARIELAIDRSEQMLRRLQEAAKPPAERLYPLRQRQVPVRPVATPSPPDVVVKPPRPTPPEYIVEPPDLVSLKTFGMLPREGLDGSHLVTPDGRMNLGPYGHVVAAGLTVDELKENILERLRVHFTDRELGLHKDIDGDPSPVKPRDSRALAVEVSGYNSKFYYVQGNVIAPGRLPITGTETVLDAINLAGGVDRKEGTPQIKLIRPARDASRTAQILPIDLNAIVFQGDQTTNYSIQPSDRIVVYRNRTANPEARQTDVVVPAAADQPARAEVSSTKNLYPRGDLVKRFGTAGKVTIAYPVADLVSKSGAAEPFQRIDFAPLAEILKDSVAPGTWKATDEEDDPDKGSIIPFFLNMSIIVRQDAEVHEQVVQRLRQIRRLRGLRIPEQESVPAPEAIAEPEKRPDRPYEHFPAQISEDDPQPAVNP